MTTDAIEQDAADKGFLHVTSHVSDPLPAAVGRAVLQTVLADDLPSRARSSSARGCAPASRSSSSRHEPIGDVRGAGPDARRRPRDRPRHRVRRAERYGTAVTTRCLELGLNVNIVQFPGFGSVLRIAPPLTITPDEIDLGLEILDRALTDSA